MNENLNVYRNGQLEADTFRLAVSTSGILVLDVSDFARGSLQPAIDFVLPGAVDPAIEALTYVERSHARSIIKVETPGTYCFGVRTNPEDPWGSYRLEVGFAEAMPLRVVEPALDGDCQALAPRDVEEWEEDDVSGRGIALAGARLLTLGGRAPLVKISEPGILELGATDTEALAFLLPVGSTDRPAIGRAVTLRPGEEIHLVVDPGLYRLGWTTAATEAQCSTPRVRFYPL